jgi:hypothetical protein
MRCTFTVLALLGLALTFTQPALAHGSEPHPKCKKGYVVNDDHKCVKAPQ